MCGLEVWGVPPFALYKNQGITSPDHQSKPPFDRSGAGCTGSSACTSPRTATPASSPSAKWTGSGGWTRPASRSGPCRPCNNPHHARKTNEPASKVTMRTPESQSKPGIKMVNPQNHVRKYKGGRSCFWLGLSLTNLHLPGFDCGSPVRIAWHGSRKSLAPSHKASGLLPLRNASR